MKIAVFTDTHIGHKQSGNFVMDLFEEQLQLVIKNQAKLVLYLGDMFDFKQPDSKLINEVKKILQKYKMRPLTQKELLFPIELQDSQTNQNFYDADQDSIPFLQICGNHEDAATLSLLNTTKFENSLRFIEQHQCQYIVPCIVNICSQLLVIYPFDYQKQINAKFKQNQIKLLSPNKFFQNQKFKDYVQQNSLQNIVTTQIVMMHQDNCKLTELFDFSFIQNFNQQLENQQYRIKYVFNGHEHSADNQLVNYTINNEQQQLHILMPGTFTQTKRQLPIQTYCKKINRSFIILDAKCNNISYQYLSCFHQYISGKLDLTIDMRYITEKRQYINIISEQIENTLKEDVLNFYINVFQDINVMQSGYEKYQQLYQQAKVHENHYKFPQLSSQKQYTEYLINLLEKQNLDFLNYINKPQLKISVTPTNFDYATQLMLSSVVFDDELILLNKYLHLSKNQRIIELHNYQKFNIENKKHIQEQMQQTAEININSNSLKFLQIQNLNVLTSFINKSLETISTLQDNDEQLNSKNLSVNKIQGEIDQICEQVNKQYYKDIECIANEQNFEVQLNDMIKQIMKFEEVQEQQEDSEVGVIKNESTKKQRKKAK